MRAGEWAEGRVTANGCEVSFEVDESILELDGGSGCTAL